MSVDSGHWSSRLTNSSHRSQFTPTICQLQFYDDDDNEITSPTPTPRNLSSCNLKKKDCDCRACPPDEVRNIYRTPVGSSNEHSIKSYDHKERGRKSLICLEPTEDGDDDDVFTEVTITTFPSLSSIGLGQEGVARRDW